LLAATVNLLLENAGVGKGLGKCPSWQCKLCRDRNETKELPSEWFYQFK
jgi:hypothetical protein